EMTRHWASSGADVTVVTGMPNHPTGILPPAYRGAVVRREDRDGARILRSWVYATPNERIARKTLAHLSFMVSSVLLSAIRTGPVDVVVVSSPTFFSVASAWLIARMRRARLVVEVRDLWPAIFVELGVLKNRRVIAILECFELAAYRAADAVVVVTEGFREDLIRRGVPPGKVTTIRNGVDLDRFSAGLQTNPTDRRWLGANAQDMLVLYIGAHGISQGLATLIETATLLDGQGVHITLVGEGADKAAVRTLLERFGATNVTMLPGVPRERVPAVLAAADVCVVPLRDVPLFSTFIPSKLFEYLGAGKAVVGAVRGEAARILEEAGAVVVHPGDPVALAVALRELATDPHRRDRMGRSGRNYVQEHFDRRVLAMDYLRLLQRLVTVDGAA
ncbi:MAG: glycosyltransferase family 4 protein, partial [Marmoricola sp.]